MLYLGRLKGNHCTLTGGALAKGFGVTSDIVTVPSEVRD
jgi:hypothetical protein